MFAAFCWTLSSSSSSFLKPRTGQSTPNGASLGQSNHTVTNLSHIGGIKGRQGFYLLLRRYSKSILFVLLHPLVLERLRRWKEYQSITFLLSASGKAALFVFAATFSLIHLILYKVLSAGSFWELLQNSLICLDTCNSWLWPFVFLFFPFLLAFFSLLRLFWLNSS